MEMRCKYSHATDALNDVFRYRRREAKSVKCAGPPPELINNNQAALRRSLQDRRCLEHFGHKGRNAAILDVTSTDAGEDMMNNVDLGR